MSSIHARPLADPPVEQVHIAQEMIDEGARGPGVDLVGGPELLHAALVQDDDAISDLEGFLPVMVMNTATAPS